MKEERMKFNTAKCREKRMMVMIDFSLIPIKTEEGNPLYLIKSSCIRE